MKEPLHTDPMIEEKEGARFVNETGEELQPLRGAMDMTTLKEEMMMEEAIASAGLSEADVHLIRGSKED
jgi:hypothetical protein